MAWWTQKQTGFTIVELLIVIVVIAILATISTVAFTGIQDRAKNAKTISAVSEWAKVLRLYKADTEMYPAVAACLGTGYGRGFSGDESAGGMCRQDNASSGGINENATFVNLMSEYISEGGPTPTFATAGSASYPWYRGAYFYPAYAASLARIDFVIVGTSTSCPDIGGLKAETGGTFTETNSKLCRVRFIDSL